ncbi:hypothetical protein NEMBOFW57_005651 [Staphylotrichum longicolle]|uniref:Ankyrin n=1 Tax=Staphylotrichum longicolle TaxID=669026 RepID=A0AAD4EXP4_9PEZI|nr:hypothetical protein NEMBOFW57_005651 [Staphylotrichum longicolle]
MVRMLLDHGADINASGGVFDNALQAAAQKRRNAETVELLLKRGANVNKQGGKYGSALQAAAAASELTSVQLLLDHGAEVNAEGEEYGTAFQAACVPWEDDDPTVDDDDRFPSLVYASTGITRLLLDHGADVHIQGGKFGSAWHAAAAARIRYLDWEELMQLLLEKGVDINDARGRLQHVPTALHAVLQTRDPWGALQKLDFLLEHGANPNLSGGTYGLPLQAACAAYYAHGRFTFSESRVRHFLDRCPEINVNATGGLFGCALQAAAYSGQTKSVALLLDKGADANLRGGKYGSALNAAIVKGYWDIVGATIFEP